MLITITKEHLKKAIAESKVENCPNESSCLVAQALKDVPDADDIFVAWDNSKVKGKYIDNSRTTKRLIAMFDRDEFKALRSMLPVTVRFTAL